MQRYHCEFSSVTIVDSSFIFVCRGSTKEIVSVSLEYDGVGISRETMQVITTYLQAWKIVQSICVVGSDLYVSKNNGISAFSLQTGMQKMGMQVCMACKRACSRKNG